MGQVGPSLDNLSEAAAAAGKPLEDFIRESIVEPERLPAAGVHRAAARCRPFDKTITGADLDTLVQYLAENTN